MSTSDKAQKLLEQSRVLHSFGTILSAGVPILVVLELMSTRSETYRAVFEGVAADVRAGGGLREGMESLEDLFHPFVLSMIEIGEQTGDLDATLLMSSNLLNRLAQFEEQGVVVDQYKLAVATDFCMLALMYDVGMPVARILNVMSKHSSQAHRGVFAAVEKSVIGGDSLSLALMESWQGVQMPRSGSLADDYNIKVIEAGEIGGVLDIVLKRLANTLMWNVLGTQFFEGVNLPPQSGGNHPGVTDDDETN